MHISQYTKMDISQDEPSLIIQKLENELTKYKSQTKKLKKQISTLENQMNSKDQQLDEKSKLIISCFSENLRLKQQIETLKRQLNTPQSNNTRRKQSKTPKSIELTPQSSMTLSSFDSNIDEIVSVNNQMPYFMPPPSNSYSIASNLSEQACEISFPSPNNNSQLSPIEENDNQYQNVFTPITVMSDINCSFKMMIQSDNNSHIQQSEWNESIATISTTPSPKSIPLVNCNSKSIPLILSVQVQSDVDDEENEFGTITTMTPSSYISSQTVNTISRNNNSESLSGAYKYGKGKSNNNFTHSNTILNILSEDKSDHSCNHSVPRMKNMDSYISIID